ncbi:DNA polymerase III epsilon subunit-like protein [Cryobacterium mesophilum]|uniref:3'-5' exonuclease n=1 Tax=Terrimesophilobacter mesophilus TaxID=433647 RepID=A0A4R8VE80_9MICO|nr:3'-5' exonuclease [Terrimesophilobacter mesophilus]MBB5633784.1 DNA polymerase III epsilon subunit-like protein [Terrimesophilobacter mesophilus]TFB80462.1 3'-5' exonuclease [Terrimesophilobacter mesophilus]
MPEIFISVDVETAGPNPSGYSMLSIGACLVDHPEQGFYVELIPLSPDITTEALSIGGLTIEHLRENGVEAGDAMRRFDEWIASVVPEGDYPVFVGFNAAFDWMFVCDYFERFLGRNPFGHSALDIKSLYLGMAGGSWAETSLRFLSPRYLQGRKLSHNALGDARDQAALYSAIVSDAAQRRQPSTTKRSTS